VNPFKLVKVAAIALPLALTVSAALGATECRSIAGQLNGKSANAVRQVEFLSNAIALSGTLNGVRSPRQSLPCKTIAKGVYCDAKFHGAIVTVMTNGRRMIETVIDPVSKREYASFAYECDRVMKP